MSKRASRQGVVEVRAKPGKKWLARVERGNRIELPLELAKEIDWLKAEGIKSIDAILVPLDEKPGTRLLPGTPQDAKTKEQVERDLDIRKSRGRMDRSAVVTPTGACCGSHVATQRRLSRDPRLGAASVASLRVPACRTMAGVAAKVATWSPSSHRTPPLTPAPLPSPRGERDG